jgi:hypothetical protein
MAHVEPFPVSPFLPALARQFWLDHRHPFIFLDAVGAGQGAAPCLDGRMDITSHARGARWWCLSPAAASSSEETGSAWSRRRDIGRSTCVAIAPVVCGGSTLDCEMRIGAEDDRLKAVHICANLVDESIEFFL